jgi:DNA helicase-2/ATP-dependent DNA helicase PcrA
MSLTGGEIMPSTSEEPRCPYCNSKMRLRNGKRGQFYGCVKFPNCKGTRDFIVYPTEIKLLPGSPEQEAIFDFLQNGTENGLIKARAGVGKSWTIVNSLARLRGVKVGVFSFNNHIIREMNERLQKEGISWARGYTYNAFGYRAIRNHPQLQSAELFEDKLPTIIHEIFPDDTDEAGTIRIAAAKLTRLCKCYMEDGKDEEVLTELVERFNIEINGDCADFEELEKRTTRIFELVPKALDLCLKRKSTLDYDDQVWWTVRMKLPVERFDIVFVDEAQDTNRMQQELLKMACP